MLSTTIVHVCPRCGSERLRKNGHANNRAQRAKCPACEYAATQGDLARRHQRG